MWCLRGCIVKLHFFCWFFYCEVISRIFLQIFLSGKSDFMNFFFANFRALWPGGCWWRYCRRWHDERWWLPLSRSSCPWKRWGYRCWGPHKRFAMTDRRISRRKKKYVNKYLISDLTKKKKRIFFLFFFHQVVFIPTRAQIRENIIINCGYRGSLKKQNPKEGPQ